MKFKKTKDFIEALSKSSKEGQEVQIDLFPKKYAFYEVLVRWGEWNGKYFEIRGHMYLKNLEIVWADDLNYLIDQLDGKEINQLGPEEFIDHNGRVVKVSGFSGFEDVQDFGGHPVPDTESIKWFKDENRVDEIQLNDNELKEFEEVGVETLWDEAGWDNQDEIDRFMDDDGILKIIVSIGQDSFALINEKYFDECDENGNWK